MCNSYLAADAAGEPDELDNISAERGGKHARKKTKQKTEDEPCEFSEPEENSESETGSATAQNHKAKKMHLNEKEKKLKVAERCKRRMCEASVSSKAPADNIGFKYPMPWTTDEALANESTLHGLTGTKLTLLSRVSSVADATSRRFRSVSSQRDCLKLACPFSNCGFSARIAFRLHGENNVHVSSLK